MILALQRMTFCLSKPTSENGSCSVMTLAGERCGRTLQAADIAGIRAFAVHAKDDRAKAFYEHFGLSALPSDPYHLFRMLKDIRAHR
jgi:hypothetical protein